jgi:hypothetical protein
LSDVFGPANAVRHSNDGGSIRLNAGKEKRNIIIFV